MKKLLPLALCAAALLSLLSGCLSMSARPRGPVDAFLFSAASNPGLPQNAVGTINMQSTPMEITVVVPPGTDVRSLAATLSLNVEAVITVVSSGQRVVQENGVTRNDFSAPVLYSIEVPKEKKPWRYKVTVREADTNPRLAQLILPEDSVLDPPFNPKVKSYTLTVPFATQQARIGARAESRYLKSISIDGASSPGASATAAVEFSSGRERSFLIETTAEDGVTREQYAFRLLRGEPDRNAALESLEIADAALLPAFSPQRQNYSVQVPYSTSQVVVRVRPQSRYATAALSAATGSGGARAALSYKGNPVERSGARVEFASLARLPIIVTVTAQDGGIREYFVEVVRAEPDRNNFLAALSVSEGAFSPAFQPNVLSYVVSVPYAVRRFSLAAQAQSRLARLALEPGPLAGGAPVSYTGDPASKDGASIDFQSTDRLSLTVAVAAEDGSVLQYFLDIRRSPPDSNADLASLTASAGLLSPIFNPRIVSYTLSLPAAVETVNLTVVTASKAAAVTSELPVAQSAAARIITVPAVPGKVVTVDIMVTAEDGSQKLYRVNVSREGGPAVQPAAPAQPEGAPAAQPALAVQPAAPGFIQVLAKNLKLGNRETAALIQGSEAPQNQAQITVRTYRTNDVLAQASAPVVVRAQGKNLVLSMSHRLEGARLGAGFIEVEVAIPTNRGRYLCYTEARPFDGEWELEVPFLLLAEKPRVAWPALGVPVKVAGYVSSAPPGADKGERAVDREDFDKNEQGEYQIVVELGDPKTAKPLGKEAVWTKPGTGRGARRAFGRLLELPEGSAVAYTLTAKGKSGKIWRASGRTQVWTTMLSYEGGFAPVLLYLADELK